MIMHNPRHNRTLNDYHTLFFIIGVLAQLFIIDIAIFCLYSAMTKSSTTVDVVVADIIIGSIYHLRCWNISYFWDVVLGLRFYDIPWENIKCFAKIFLTHLFLVWTLFQKGIIIKVNTLACWRTCNPTCAKSCNSKESCNCFSESYYFWRFR